MRHCSSCRNLGMDTKKALDCGVVIDKCYEFGFYVLHPFLSGFRCPRYKEKNGSFLWHMPKKDGD